MARVTVEDCLPLVDNRFALVLLATKRARQLMAGARPLIEAKDKPPVLALREVATGKVRFEAALPVRWWRTVSVKPPLMRCSIYRSEELCLLGQESKFMRE